MAQTVTIKLTNRSPNQPIKKLPSTIEVPVETSVENVKALIARQTGFSDHHRIGLFDPTTRKTLKDRKAEIGSVAPVIASGELLVKDLGPQIAWRTVFIFEYMGPILFHVLIHGIRRFLYGKSAIELSSTQWLGFYMFNAHFLKREFETLFVHKFSASTMPVRNIYKNCVFYWVFSGLICALEIYAPFSPAAYANNQTIDNVGTAIYLFGEISNAIVHYNLASLRSAGGTERKVPTGYGFGIVTCPNYMFETISWIGVIIAMRSPTTVLFIILGVLQMYPWGKQKEAAYRKEFPETYKPKKFVMLPGFL